MPNGDSGLANTFISLRAVRKNFAQIEAVAGVDLDIQRAEIFGLIGHNGAGKSTLFRMLLGLLPASSGEIRIDGVSVAGRDFRTVRRQIGYLPENVVLYDNLSGLETLHYFADLKGANRAEAPALLEKVGLAHAAQRRVRGYSKGMRQRLGFAQALLGRPKLLFLDEPTNGLDPEAIREFYAVLQELKSQGVTIVITSHILAEIQERVDRLAIMKLGKIEALGSLQQLREENDLPLTIQARLLSSLRHMSPSLETALQALDLTWQVVDGVLHVSCPRRQKMAALVALVSEAGQFENLDMREPTLEDVFLGYAA